MKSRIKADLEKLQQEVEWLTDAESRRSMEVLLADLQQQLSKEVHAEAELKTRLQAAVTEFEAEYPTVAGILKNILATLGNMGI